MTLYKKTVITSAIDAFKAALNSRNAGEKKPFLTESTIEIKKTSLSIGSRDKLNFIEGSNVTLTIVDDPINKELDITISTFGADSNYLVFINTLADLPVSISNVITLADNVTYFFTTEIDLNGSRLVCGINTTIIGGSSENCRIKSTGLALALITSTYSLPIRNITIEADLALALDGDGITTALDWFGVNFTDCAVIGTIKDMSNVNFTDCAFLNSGGLTFDGTIGTIAINNSLIDCNAGNTAIILPATLTVSRRFRVIYSSFVVLAGETGINVNVGATFNEDERYILDTVNFSGGGTYISGVDQTSNKALFINCVGISNTAVNGQIYMQGNVTATTISVQNTFVKVAGVTTASADNSKYLTPVDNRLTNDATVTRKYLIQCILSFNGTSNDVYQFGFYDSKLSAIRTPSKTKATANAAGRAENVAFTCVVSHTIGDYLEIHSTNTSGARNCTVDALNFIVTEIK